MFFGNDKIIRLQSVDSTNDFMAKQLRSSTFFKEGTIVIALEQTSGKGLDKNIWESEPGKNLTFSILLKPVFLRADQQFILNKSISLGVYDFIKAIITNQKVRIKWPNDIYVEDKKIAGILISNTIEGNELKYTIVGIGVNINQLNFPEFLRNPVSLAKVLRKEFDLDQVLNELLFWIENRYEQLVNNEWSLINDHYLEALYRLNEQHSYFYNNEIVNACITGISDYGHLQLLTNKNEILECDFKEIEFII